MQLILGNQLFDPKYIKETEVFMCEDIELCRHFKPHKLKIKLFLCAMREYRDEIQAKKTIHYFELASKPQFFQKLKKSLGPKKKLCIFEIEDKFFEEDIFLFCKKNGIELEILPTPNFLCSRDEFSRYLEQTKKPFMKSFYEEWRKKLDILMDGNKPKGGKYSFDSANRKKIPKKFKEEFPKRLEIKSPYEEEVEKLIQKYFSNHPGKDCQLVFPTNRKTAKKALDLFLKNKMQNFGDYEDALDDRDPFLFHSLLSTSLNLGLLNPYDVAKAAEKMLTKNNINSVEGFIRQVIGWREFVRGIYQNYSERQDHDNFFGHNRKLKPCWWDGSTGIPIVDKTINKALKYGYCHHIERLMVLSNLMLMLEVDPREVHRWFMEMFIDSLDWVMGPNVYGMGQFSDGGIFATKPYFSGSNYILKMSHEKKGDWCDAWDGLYWNFIHKNRDFFAKNYRMSMMVKMYDKMDEEKKLRITKAAKNLQRQLTQV